MHSQQPQIKYTEDQANHSASLCAESYATACHNMIKDMQTLLNNFLTQIEKFKVQTFIEAKKHFPVEDNQEEKKEDINAQEQN